MTETVVKETQTRVAETTPHEVNERIRRQIEANIVYYAQRLDAIEERLNDLDKEWDIERTLETSAGVVTLVGLTFGLFSRRWNILPVLASAFLIQHAVEGWCPPAGLLRRMGVRTSREIHQERYALKALRGDFHRVNPKSQEDALTKANKAMQSVEVER